MARLPRRRHAASVPRLCLAPLLLLALLPGASQGRFEPDLISQNGRETHLARVPRGADDLVLMHEIVRLTRFDAAGSVLGEEQHTQDSNGNRIQEADFRLFWDSFDRLVRVERTSDGLVVGRYRYDALGRRVDRSFVAQGEVASQQVFHVHDGAREVEELDAAGDVLADFLWGGMYVDELVQLRRGGQTYYAHSSSIYSVAALSDSAGNAVERYAYKSIYGVCQVQDGAGAPKNAAAEVGNPWRFQGRRFDPETGFYYFRARQLDSQRGRFVSRDPLGLWGDPGQVGNSYSFAGNDPVNGVDPSGLRNAPGIGPGDAWHTTDPYYVSDPYATNTLQEVPVIEPAAKFMVGRAYGALSSLGEMGAGFAGQLMEVGGAAVSDSDAGLLEGYLLSGVSGMFIKSAEIGVRNLVGFPSGIHSTWTSFKSNLSLSWSLAWAGDSFNAGYYFGRAGVEGASLGATVYGVSSLARLSLRASVSYRGAGAGTVGASPSSLFPNAVKRSGHPPVFNQLLNPIIDGCPGTSCLPTATAEALAAANIELGMSIPQLTRAMGTSGGGTFMANALKALEARGVQAQTFTTLTTEQLAAAVRSGQPMVISVRNLTGGSHAIVVDTASRSGSGWVFGVRDPWKGVSMWVPEANMAARLHTAAELGGQPAGFQLLGGPCSGR